MPNDEAERLKERMEATSVGVAPALEAHIQATLAYGIAVDRTGYEALAERNRGLIELYSRRTKKLLVGLVVMLLALGVVSVFLAAQTSNLEHRTCTIQDNSLKAGPHLVEAMKDVGILFVPTPAEKKLPKEAERVFTNFRVELAEWVTLEDELPPEREC